MSCLTRAQVSRTACFSRLVSPVAGSGVSSPDILASNLCLSLPLPQTRETQEMCVFVFVFVYTRHRVRGVQKRTPDKQLCTCFRLFFLGSQTRATLEMLQVFHCVSYDTVLYCTWLSDRDCERQRDEAERERARRDRERTVAGAKEQEPKLPQVLWRQLNPIQVKTRLLKQVLMYQPLPPVPSSSSLLHISTLIDINSNYWLWQHLLNPLAVCH